MLPQKTEPIRGLASVEDFAVHHFLSQHRSCSKKLIHHLLTRRALPEVNEIIHLIDGSKTTGAQLVSAGFHVETLSEEAAVATFNL